MGKGAKSTVKKKTKSRSYRHEYAGGVLVSFALEEQCATLWAAGKWRGELHLACWTVDGGAAELEETVGQLYSGSFETLGAALTRFFYPPFTFELGGASDG